MNSNRSIARLHIPSLSQPSTPAAVRRPCLEPMNWSRSPVLRRPSVESNGPLPSSSSSPSSVGWGHHFLPPADSTPLLSTTRFLPIPQSYDHNGGFPNVYRKSVDRSVSNDSGSGTGWSPTESPKDYYYGSILKKQNGYQTEGTLRRSLQRGARRKVGFNNSVSVYWYDSDAESVSSPTESRRIDLESSGGHSSQGQPVIGELYGESVRNHGSLKKHHQGLLCTGNAQNFRDRALTAPCGSPVGTQRRRGLFPPLVPNGRTSFSATPRCPTSAPPSAQLSIVEDQVTLRRKLVVAVQLRPELHPGDVLVKANKNGNKIRVVISKDAGPPGNRTGCGVNEHISLPVEVDPYQLSARLDREGILHIEAPVLS